MIDSIDGLAADRRLRRARAAILGSAAFVVLSTLTLGGIGLVRESDPRWIVLGAIGVLAVVIAQAGLLYVAITPVSTRARRGWLAGFLAAAVLSIPSTAPVGDGRWETWAWLGGSIAGTLPLVLPRWAGIVTVITTLAVGVAVAVGTSAEIVKYVLIIASVAAMIIGVNGLQIWLWSLLVQARQGQLAQVRLAAVEERMRFARDVHDLLGHDLSVIALKAELAARLAPVDADRAGREAAEVRSLAAAALDQVRAVVHGYRDVDPREQLAAIERVLRSSGVRCTVSGFPAAEGAAGSAVEPPAADLFVPVLREAATNILRHSRASWCTIVISQETDRMVMTVANDGADQRGPDHLSSGLRGLADRLGAAGGSVRTTADGGVFTLEAVLPVTP